ncbi:MAG: hypothetical protein QME51_11860, partial [Planctomycetota bacterium]|nr:hypothetical protein [Planctomycetota bacterium]
EKSVGVDKATLPPEASGEESEDQLNKKYTIYQMWTDTESVVVELKSGQILSIPPHSNIFAERETYKKPFVLARPLSETGIIYGRSPIDRLVIIQDELNELRYERRKKRDIIIKGIILALKGSGISWDRFKRDAIIEARDDISERTIRRLELTNILPTLDIEEERLLNYADRNTGIYDPIRGGGEGNVTKTASGLAMLIKEGNLLFAEQIAKIQISGIKEIIEHLILLNQENLSEEKNLFLKKEETRISSEQIKGNFQIIVTSAPGLGMKELQQEQISALQIKYAQDPRIDQDAMTRKELILYDLDPEEMMLSEEELDIKQQNEALAQENEILKQ